MPVHIGKVTALNKVYNTDTLTWDAMRQPSTAGGGASTVAASTQVAVSNFPETQAVTGTVSVTGYVAPSTQVTVSGYVAPSTTVSVSGYVAPSTTVSIANIPHVIVDAMPAGLTDAELRAAPVPVSGTVSVSGYVAPSTTVSVANWPATQPVSGTVSVSGYVAPSTTVSVANTVTVTGALTDAQLRAAPIEVTGGGGSTQVSIRELLSSSGGSLVDSSRVSLRVTVTEQPAGGSTKVSAWLFDSTGLSLESSTRSNAGSTMRGLAVRSIVPDCTNASGFSSAAGDLTLLTSNAQAVYVYGVTVTKYSSVVNVLRLMNGSTAQALYLSASGINGGGTGSTGAPAGSGFTLQVSPPAYLCKTSTGNPLILSRSSSGHFSYGVFAWREG